MRPLDYIYDDAGAQGGLADGERFVIAGDQNSDPLDGDSIAGSIQQLIDHPLVNTRFTPQSDGAVEAAILQGGANLTHRSDPRFDTADFADGAPGNLRADYVLPRKGIQIVDGAVFWPVQAGPLFRLTGGSRSQVRTIGQSGSIWTCPADPEPAGVAVFSVREGTGNGPQPSVARTNKPPNSRLGNGRCGAERYN